MNLLWLLLCLLPASRLKNRLLSLAPGWDVASDARFGPNLVWGVGRFVVGSETSIGVGNVFRSVPAVLLGERVIIGQFNWVTAAASDIARDNSERRRGMLRIGRGGGLTSRHYVDVSGGLDIGEFSIIGGVRSTVLSHALDVREDEQVVTSVVLGAHSLVLTNCTVLPGTELGERVVVAGNALVRGALLEPDTLYAGSPAKPVGTLRGAKFFDRG